MRHFHKKPNLYYRPSINIDRLWSLVPEEVYAKAKAGSEEAPIIDVTKLVREICLIGDYQFILLYFRAISRCLARATYPKFLLLSKPSSSAKT